MTPVLALLPLGTALAWKLHHLYRHPSSAPLRAFTLCLVFACASYPLVSSGGASYVDALAGQGTAKLGRTVLALAGSYSLMCFYLYSAADAAAGRRRARWEGVVVLLMIAAALITAGYVPTSAFVGDFATADRAVPQLMVFYVIVDLYLFYVLAMATWWTCVYARKSSRPYAVGLWTAAAGLSGQVIACAVRLAILALRWWTGHVPDTLTTGTGAFPLLAGVAFTAGITYPAACTRVMAIRLWLRHRRLHRQLEPLWLLLTRAYPETVLHTTTASGTAWGGLRGVHLRCHRRIIECRDGLVRISPHISRRALADPSGAAGPVVLAAELRRAARAVEQGLPACYEPVLLAVPSHGAVDADVQQLVALSLALGERSDAICPDPTVRSIC